MTNKPTMETYTEMQQAYDFFNNKLFNNELPDCLIILDKKNTRTLGYYSPDNFKNRIGQSSDCIAMNPIYFAKRTINQVLSTLVHEMVHLWQNIYGKPSRRGYHNKQWGAKMKELGLHPSDTGQAEGKESGQRMSHYIIENGPFDRTCNDLLTKNFVISWYAHFPEDEEDNEGSQGKKNKTNRFKYTCECGLNVWGKPGLNVLCAECKTFFLCEEVQEV